MNTITLTDEEWRVVEGAMVVAAKEVPIPALYAAMEEIRVKIEEQHYADICAATAAVEAEMEAELIEQTKPVVTVPLAKPAGAVTVSMTLVAWRNQGETKDDVLADVVGNLGDVDSASATQLAGGRGAVRVAVKFPALSEDEGRRIVRHLSGRLRNAHDSVVVSVRKRKVSR